MRKPIIYAEVPDFNQETQYVIQSTPVDMGDYIFIGLEILESLEVIGEEGEEYEQ